MTTNPGIREHYEKALEACRDLYVGSAKFCVENYPSLIETPADSFIELMNDLHRGLLIKIYVTVAQSDLRWSNQEKVLAQILIEHIWHRHLEGRRLREAAQRMFEDARDLSWYSVVRPFDTIFPLRERISELQTVVLRVANITAKCDGTVTPGEEKALREIQSSLHNLFHGNGLDPPKRPADAAHHGTQAVKSIEDKLDEADKRAVTSSQQKAAEEELTVKPDSDTEPASDKPTLEEALGELDKLIGLESVKREVRSLANFLEVQQQRKSHGLPTTDLSLHMVFRGNPGTGKTTVARIIGHIFEAMGVLEKGHLIETDRSGLVAEYAGQTGPKTNAKIDEAMDGVLFIDEAYSLAAKSPDDPYGAEAIQAILKRMEDDRERLVIILAGYPGPMEELLTSNPGLSSRFNTYLDFPDYEPHALGAIFETMCQSNNYQIPAETRLRLLGGFDVLYQQRDEHFGNGRLARNVFERAIRRLANRIVGVAPLTTELLTVLEPGDIHFDQLPQDLEAETPENIVLKLKCPNCESPCSLQGNFLGMQMTCPGCKHSFIAGWASLGEV